MLSVFFSVWTLVKLRAGPLIGQLARGGCFRDSALTSAIYDFKGYIDYAPAEINSHFGPIVWLTIVRTVVIGLILYIKQDYNY